LFERRITHEKDSDFYRICDCHGPGFWRSVPLQPPAGAGYEARDTPQLAQVQAAAQQQDDLPSDKTCSGKGLVKIISLGQASLMDLGGYGADAIRLIWVNYDLPAVVRLALLLHPSTSSGCSGCSFLRRDDRIKNGFDS
jgi:hypothetical protein